MSLIRIPILFEGAKGNKIINVLFHPETNFSCLNREVAQFLGEAITLRGTRSLSTGTYSYKDIAEAMILDFTINNVNLFDSFFLVPGLDEEAIIGATTLRKWRIKLNHEHNAVIVDPAVARLQLL